MSNHSSLQEINVPHSLSKDKNLSPFIKKYGYLCYNFQDAKF